MYVWHCPQGMLLVLLVVIACRDLGRLWTISPWAHVDVFGVDVVSVDEDDDVIFTFGILSDPPMSSSAPSLNLMNKMPCKKCSSQYFNPAALTADALVGVL